MTDRKDEKNEQRSVDQDKGEPNWDIEAMDVSVSMEGEDPGKALKGRQILKERKV